jgi:hypothetical protein
VAVAGGVVEEVGHDAQERLGVATHRQAGGVTAHVQRAAARCGQRLDGLRRAADDLGDVHLRLGHRLAGILKATEREEVGDEAIEVGGLVLRAVEVVAVPDAALDRLQRAAQGEQRRAQVVGDRGDHEAPLALGCG